MDHPSLTASKRQTASRPSGSTPPAGKRRELDSADAGGDDSAFTTIEGENVVPDLLLVATAAAPVNFLDGTPVSSSIALASSTSSHLLQCDVQAPHVKVHADGAAAATAGDSTISSIAAVDELKHLVDKVSHLGASAVARGITAMTSVIAAIEEGEASSASSAHALPAILADAAQPTPAEQLLTAMKEAPLESIEGSLSGAKLVRLANGIEWPQLRSPLLFVRHFYEACAINAMRNLPAGERFIIRGNGGIGKSAFGLFLMWCAVKAERTVVYVTDKDERGYIFHADGRARSFMRSKLRKAAASEMLTPGALLIFDGDGDCKAEGTGKPPMVPATTVVVTSPKRSRYKTFEHTGAAHLVFPVFARSEVDDMLESCFPHLKADAERAGVDERYHRWGGIPRYVLSLLRPAAQKQLDDAVLALDLDKVADTICKGDIEDDTDISHRLLHLKPAGESADGFVGGGIESDYNLARTELGSPFIAGKVYAALQASRANKINALLAQPTKGTQLAKLYGDLYQQHALAQLQQGGEFTVYALGGDAPEDARISVLKLPPSESRYFRKCDELASCDKLAERLWLPPPGFAAVDMVLPGLLPANFTINEEHDLLLYAKGDKQGLLPVAQALGIAQGPIPFYWVMPAERVDHIRAKGCPTFPVKLRGAPLKAPLARAAVASGTGAAAVGGAGADSADVIMGSSSARRTVDLERSVSWEIVAAGWRIIFFPQQWQLPGARIS